ncbi:hypothetical protein F442_14222 [Phytophthora nicotianae P10297]|uniref:Uncharacterized protein n=1 Tax=Phytophthora nicotianae P10297 TaxID=1317064 RepID=W2YSQ3_PHYNI|nr:hypothetical protein F442_14222 [Phytophthora nicotianae P10297]
MAGGHSKLVPSATQLRRTTVASRGVRIEDASRTGFAGGTLATVGERARLGSCRRGRSATTATICWSIEQNEEDDQEGQRTKEMTPDLWPSGQPLRQAIPRSKI